MSNHSAHTTVIMHEFPASASCSRPPAGYSGRLSAGSALVQAILSAETTSRVVVVAPRASIEQWTLDAKEYEYSHKLEFCRFDQPPAEHLTADRVVFQSLTPSLRVGMHLRSHWQMPWVPVVGLTHDLSSVQVYDDLLLSQIGRPAPFDAIVATSPTARDVLGRLLAAASVATGVEVQPGIRVIPLGLHRSPPSPRADARTRQGIPESSLMLLAFGRLNYRMKADLVPLLRAFQAAGPRLGNALLVVAGGLAGSEDIDTVARYELAANELGVSGSVRLMPDVDDAARSDLLAAADLLVGLADSYQESFGLVLLEAMQAGLPIIASDFDGYRDLLRGTDAGVLIPTSAPSTSGTVSAGALIEDRSWIYESLSQTVATDERALTEAIVRLGTDAPARRRMAAAGPSLVGSHYRWDKIIDRYHDLWSDLIDEGRAHQDAARPYSWYDHGDVFRDHPTTRIDADTRIEGLSLQHAECDERLRANSCGLDTDRLRGIVRDLKRHPVRIADAIGTDPESLRCAAFLLKHGLVSLA